MQADQTIDWVPKTVMLLGTDASGKNHVARLWARRLRELGCELVIKEGRISAGPAEDRGHEEKGRLALLAERGFLIFFPLTRWFLPPLVSLLMHLDARAYRAGGGNSLIVSHSALRILAFCLGQNDRYLARETLPTWLEQAIRRLQLVSGAVVIVLDVDDQIRQARIRQRLEQGSIDPFDAFMAADSARSERIEACLVALARRYFNAHLFENNNLDDEALWREFEKACGRG